MDDCIFCEIIRGDSPSWKIYENEHVYAFLDINPVSRYHTLVIPKVHCTNIFDIGEKEIKEVASAIRQICGDFREKLGIDNVQIVSSNGADAQQDVFHSHFHIVPRISGDGQNIRWKIHPEWRNEFDGLLGALV